MIVRRNPFCDTDMGHSNSYGITARSSSREVRIRVPFFSVVYFSRGTQPKKGVRKGT